LFIFDIFNISWIVVFNYYYNKRKLNEEHPYLPTLVCVLNRILNKYTYFNITAVSGYVNYLQGFYIILNCSVNSAYFKVLLLLLIIGVFCGGRYMACRDYTIFFTPIFRVKVHLLISSLFILKYYTYFLSFSFHIRFLAEIY
jgi:hypothetical protein